MIDLRVGRWQEALADVGEVDAVICDPPYSEHTHAANSNMERFNLNGHAPRRNLSYANWDSDNVREFIEYWHPRTKGWIACMCDDLLIRDYREAFAAVGRLAFAPVPCIWNRPRMSGDGPASCTVYLMVARRRTAEASKCGSLPGWYGPITAPRATDPDHHIGGKPAEIMRAIIGDYTRPGDLVCDPCAGGATTLLAAYQTGRRAVGSELDPATYAKAKARLDRALAQPHLFDPGLPRAAQQRLGE